MIYIGIDPGKSGAMAMIGEDGITVLPFSETTYLAHLRALSQPSRENARVCLEHVHSMSKQGVTSSFNFGQSFGWLLGVLDALALSYELVDPKKWKKEFSVTADKNTSIAVAKRLFPGVSLLRSDRCRKQHDGMAEALLMAEYARRRL